MRRVLGLIFAVAVALVVCRPVLATVEPGAVTLVVAPGEVVQQILSITNDTNARQTYVLEVVGVTFGDLADDLGFVALEPNIKDLIRLSETTFNLERGDRQDVRLSFALPEDRLDEAFTFAVIVRTEVEEGSGVGVATAHAALFFVEPDTGLAPSLKIEAFETIPIPDHSLPVRFAGMVTNEGDGLSQPEVGIVIRNPWGHEIEHLSLNQTARRVPPQTSRIFSAEWQGHPWRLGPYTAEFYVYPDETDTVLIGSLRVVLFPWQMLCVLAVLGLIFSGTVYACIRARRQQHEA